MYVCNKNACLFSALQLRQAAVSVTELLTETKNIEATRASFIASDRLFRKIRLTRHLLTFRRRTQPQSTNQMSANSASLSRGVSFLFLFFLLTRHLAESLHHHPSAGGGLMVPTCPEWSTCWMFSCFWSQPSFRPAGVPLLTKSERLACVYLWQK